jgi:hypothetical protein
MSAWWVSNPLHPGPEADAMATVPPLSQNERSFEAEQPFSKAIMDLSDWNFSKTEQPFSHLEILNSAPTKNIQSCAHTYMPVFNNMVCPQG